MFPAPLGGWRDPSNTQADLRAAFSNAGFGHITSHVIRTIDEARLATSREDQCVARY